MNRSSVRRGNIQSDGRDTVGDEIADGFGDQLFSDPAAAMLRVSRYLGDLADTVAGCS